MMGGFYSSEVGVEEWELEYVWEIEYFALG